MAKQKSWKMDFYGSDELLRKIRDLGGNVEGAISKAVEASFVAVGNDMQTFVGVKHKYSGSTEKAFVDYSKVKDHKWRKHRLNVKVGYDRDKGGEAAIFLQVGTPKMPPYFFLTKSYHDNELDIIRAQEKALYDEVNKLTKR